MLFKQHARGASSRILSMQLMLIVTWLLFGVAALNGAIKDHPRVLLTDNDLSRITSSILRENKAQHDFTVFLQNKKYIADSLECSVTTASLHRLLNKVMKNSFLYMVGSFDQRILSFQDYAHDPNQYMQNIEDDILCLLNPKNIRVIQEQGELLGPGYAVKALAIAYDWGYDYFAEHNRILLYDLETALRAWGDWFVSPHRYYGSVFSNHAPWGAKSLGYIAAALADDELFYGNKTKTQTSLSPQNNITSFDAQVNISAKGFFDQILHAVNFVAFPRGGWHESVSYYLTKELPELLEFSEIICTYHNETAYTASIYTSSIFKNAGVFLLHMTTPDGLLQKIGDTGAKTALPAEKYQPGGYTYGDVNDIGAGYLAGYFLNRIDYRLRQTSQPEHAEVLKYYIDHYCFDFTGSPPSEESSINLLYSLLWNDYSNSATPSDANLKNNSLYCKSIYFDNIGVLLSKNGDSRDPATTIVRFDVLPYFFSGHQHFAAGNFTIFKGANLAIDGGRYTSSNTPETKSYYEDVYRHALSHNVVLVGDSLLGQKSFYNQPDRAPYTEQQLDAFQEYGTGPQNVATFLSEKQKEDWTCPWQFNGMRLQLAKLYQHTGVDSYIRTMLHLYRPSQPSAAWSDFIFIYDTISMRQPTSSHWQMHFRDNGKSSFYGDSVYVVVRDEFLDSSLVKSTFGSRYYGQLFIRSLNEAATPSIVNFEFPDSICQNCWNGRIWEESTHILRYTLPAAEQHAYLNVLAPVQLEISQARQEEFSHMVKKFDETNLFFKSIEISIPGKNKDDEKERLYICQTDPHRPVQNKYMFSFSELVGGWLIIFGIKPGEWTLNISTAQTGIIFDQRAFTCDSNPNTGWGVLSFALPKTIKGGQNYSLSLRRLK